MGHRGLPPTVLLFVLTAGSCVVNSPFMVYLALYAKSLGFSTVQWSALITGELLLASVSLLALPTLLRRVGPRSLLLVGFLLEAACFAVIVVGTRTLIVAGTLAFGPLATVNSMCVVTELQRGRTAPGRLNSGFFVISGCASIVAPVLAATLVNGPLRYASLWFVDMGITAAQAVACLLLSRHAAEAPDLTAAPGERSPRIHDLLRSGLGWMLLGCAVLEPFTYQPSGLYAALRLSALGLSDASIGYVASAGAVVYLASSILSFFVLDKLDIRVSFAVFLAGAALGVVGFGLSAAVLPAILCMFGHQMFYGWLHPAKNVRYARFSTPLTLPTVFSLTISVQSFSGAAVGAVASGLVGLLGMQPLIVAGGLLGATGAALTLGTPAHARGSRRHALN